MLGAALPTTMTFTLYFEERPLIHIEARPEPLSQGDRAFNSTYPPEPIRVSVALAPKRVGRKEPPCYGRIQEGYPLAKQARTAE
jgi:hypothetical protein